MKIALDAMGGDFAPRVTVEGALQALDELGDDLTIALVGPEDVIRGEMTAMNRAAESRISIVHAAEVITMHDKAGKSVRQKRDSSLVRAIELHQAGEADAVVSAGHTGAQMAASYMILGLIEGVRRPTIGGLFPVGNGRFSVLLDVGANTDCKPINLLQFAIMGSVFIEIITGTQNARVGLLSIGTEKSKGNEQVLEAHYLLEQSGLNFIGNIEGSGLLTGEADVIVCDGFVGNVLLKFAESVAPIFLSRIKQQDGANPQMSQQLRQIQKEMDYAEIGGVPLLGVNGISIICHGHSSPKAIKNAIRQAITLRRGDLAGALSRGVSQHDVSMFTRGMARFKSFQERRAEESEGETDD